MTLPTSGSLSLSDVLVELRATNPGRGAPISLGDADVLALAGKSAPPISLSDLYGKSSYIPMSGSVPNVNDSAPSNPASTYTTSTPVSMALSGGRAPFTYAWTKVSGAGTVTAANAASTTTKFSVGRFSQPGETQSAVVQCAVTDAAGAQLVRQGTVTLTLD